MLSQAEKNAALLKVLATEMPDLEVKLAKVKTLLEEGAEPDARDAKAVPALFHAIGAANPKTPEKLVALLADAGADMNITEPVSGRNAFFFVRETRLVLTLVEHGADILQPDAEGETAHDFYHAIVEEDRTPPPSDARAYDSLRWIGTTVAAMDWLAQKQESGTLRYSAWLEELNLLEESGRFTQNSDIYRTQEHFWLTAFPLVLRACETAGQLQRDDLFTPDSVRWLGTAMARSTALCSQVQRFCEQQGKTLGGEELVASGLGEKLIQAGNLHFLFSYEYWSDKEWPDMLRFLNEVPEAPRNAMLDREKSHGALLVPHLRNWLESEETQALPNNALARKLLSVPPALMERLGSVERMVVEHRALQTGAKMGRA